MIENLVKFLLSMYFAKNFEILILIFGAKGPSLVVGVAIDVKEKDKFK